MTEYYSNYEVEPCSRQDLREFAQFVRKTLKITSIKFPICQLLDALTSFDIFYDVIDDQLWDQSFGKEKHAEYNLSKRTIYIKESVFERACNGFGRDRFTITHEFAHALLLDGTSIKLSRNSISPQKKLYTNPEWQADCLAGELLIPYNFCKNMSPKKISHICGVSLSAAHYQSKKF